MPEQRNLILAIVLSVTIIIAFQYFYELPRLRDAQRQAPATTTQTAPAGQPAAQGDATRPTPPGAATGQAGVAAPSGEEVQPATARVGIKTPRLAGSIALTSGRIDNIVLPDYRVTIEPNSPPVALFSPPGTPHAYFAEFGWVADGGTVALPDQHTVWQADHTELTPEQPVTLRWDNGQGLRFSRVIEADQGYMLTVTQSVENYGSAKVALHPYGLVRRWGTPETQHFYILHEGPIGVLDGRLHEIDYADLQEDGAQELPSQGGWLGITDKYWLAALVPNQGSQITANFRHNLAEGSGQDRYQVDYLGPAMQVEPGAKAAAVDRLFVGAKEVEQLDRYSAELGIPLFDRAVDFGWFYFLTKPIFHVLHFFHQWVGNYGIAILLLTLVVKLLFFPLANKSYKAMSQMKKLQPEMLRLREQFGDDKMKLNQELMGLYKKEKVNPMSGCLPIIVQIPVFFALYKVLFVSIEMRHAPFFGWIHDLSAPDPTSLFNLFGLLPFTPPHALMIGVWPLAMGLTMFLQQKLNPQPADPTQAKVMMFLPVMFIFLFATFPAGLVIYWTWNNILSISQQWLIMKRMGVSA